MDNKVHNPLIFWGVYTKNQAECIDQNGEIKLLYINVVTLYYYRGKAWCEPTG